MRMLFVFGAIVFSLLGVVHGALTVRDLWIPRSFTPSDEGVRLAMAQARLRLAPQTTIWNAWVGFNLSHSLGLFVFGALFGAIAVVDFTMITGSLFLRVSAVVVGVAYMLLAWRYWFWVPATLSAVGTLCFLISAVSG